VETDGEDGRDSRERRGRQQRTVGGIGRDSRDCRGRRERQGRLSGETVETVGASGEAVETVGGDGRDSRERQLRVSGASGETGVTVWDGRDRRNCLERERRAELSGTGETGGTVWNGRDRQTCLEWERQGTARQSPRSGGATGVHLGAGGNSCREAGRGRRRIHSLTQRVPLLSAGDGSDPLGELLADDCNRSGCSQKQPGVFCPNSALDLERFTRGGRAFHAGWIQLSIKL